MKIQGKAGTPNASLALFSDIMHKTLVTSYISFLGNGGFPKWESLLICEGTLWAFRKESTQCLRRQSFELSSSAVKVKRGQVREALVG